MADLLRQVRALDPVPADSDMPVGMVAAAVVLQDIDERTNPMQTRERPTERVAPSPRRPKRRPILVAAAAFAAVIILGVVILTIPGGDGSAPVATTTTAIPTTTVTPTTAAAPTTTIPVIDPTADPAALSVIEAMKEAFEAGDMDSAEALFAPESRYFTENASAGFSAEIWYRSAMGVTVESECSLGSTGVFTEGVPPLAGGTIVVCNDTLISGLEPGTVIGGGDFAVEVLDGEITDIFILPGYVGALTETAGLDLYRSWMRDNHPETFEELFAFGVTPRVDTPERRASHREWVAFFLGSTGPRSELALAADTPLIDVATTFQTRWDDGDVAGYEALFHPASGYVSGQDAAASWFGAVTGMTVERDCSVVGPTQVQCDEVVYSGLVLGAVVGEFTTLWNGDEGWIWTIEFPDGPPPVFTDPTNGMGVAEYRQWLRENEPAQLEQLFASGETMRLDTQEIRDAHRAAIARYLGTTNG